MSSSDLQDADGRRLRAARRADWKATPPPVARKRIEVARSYSGDELARIAFGEAPRAMEDKWFIYWDEPWLYVHRSWTGFCIFQARLAADGAEFVTVESWANRDPDQYREADDARDVALLTWLLDRLAGRFPDFPAQP